jgi:hypothetical protein
MCFALPQIWMQSNVSGLIHLLLDKNGADCVLGCTNDYVRPVGVREVNVVSNPVVSDSLRKDEACQEMKKSL